MAENKPPEQKAPAKAQEPYGPGLMAVFGLVLVVIAAFCGRDYFWPAKEWEQAPWKVWFNGGAMAGATLAAIYCFVAAVLRSKKKSGESQDPPAGDK